MAMEAILLIHLFIALALILWYVVIEFPTKPECKHIETDEIPVCLYDKDGEIVVSFTMTTCVKCKRLI